MIQLPTSMFYKTYKESGKTNVIDLTIDQKSTPVIIHSIDIDPVFNEARHIDFLAVDLKQKIQTQVPLVFVGEPIGVKEKGAVLVTNFEEIEVEALPDDIPSEIEINVESLEDIGDSITVESLPKNDLYEIVSDMASTIAVLVAQSTEEDFASDEGETLVDENGEEIVRDTEESGENTNPEGGKSTETGSKEKTE